MRQDRAWNVEPRKRKAGKVRNVRVWWCGARRASSGQGVAGGATHVLECSVMDRQCTLRHGMASQASPGTLWTGAAGSGPAGQGRQGLSGRGGDSHGMAWIVLPRKRKAGLAWIGRSWCVVLREAWPVAIWYGLTRQGRPGKSGNAMDRPVLARHDRDRRRAVSQARQGWARWGPPRRVLACQGIVGRGDARQAGKGQLRCEKACSGSVGRGRARQGRQGPTGCVPSSPGQACRRKSRRHKARQGKATQARQAPLWLGWPRSVVECCGMDGNARQVGTIESWCVWTSRGMVRR